MDTLISIKNLHIKTGDKSLLELPEFHVKKGEIHGVIGESGSGKSLLLFSMIGLLSPALKMDWEAIWSENGEPVFLNQSDQEKFRLLRGKSMGMVFQEPMTALNPRQKCGVQIAELFRIHKNHFQGEIKTAILNALSEVGLENPERIYNSFPHQISGGQRQRVMIAMATILRPPLVLADEPTTALDPETGEAVLNVLVQRCRNTGSSLILVSHDLKSVAQFADRITVLRQGKVITTGSANEVLKKGNVPYVNELLDATKSPDARSFDVVGSQLEIWDIMKSYGSGKSRHQVLNHITMSAKQGETIALLGKSGSGKSTLAKILTGLSHADSGSVYYRGTDLLKKEITGIQMVFQDPYASLNPEISCGSAIEEVFKIRGIKSEIAREKTIDLLQKVGLDAGFMKRFPHQLSGGQRQRVCIARALAAEPEILILDEAVAALDPLVQKQVLLLLQDIQSASGIIYLFITHNPEIANHFANHAWKISNGNFEAVNPKV